MSTVLIIDDHEATSNMYKMALESADFNVEILPNGIGLIKHVRGIKPDCVVLDIMMPWVDGYELCQTLRDTEDLADLPILFVSAKTSPEDIRKGEEVGANGFLEKPVDIDHLIRTVKELCP